MAILNNEGYTAEGHIMYLADRDSVYKLAARAGAAGYIEAIIHTAEISPSMGTANRIYEVNLLGTAYVIDAFFSVASAGTSLV